MSNKCDQVNDNRPLRPRERSGCLRNLPSLRWCGLLSGYGHTLALTSPGALSGAPRILTKPNLQIAMPSAGRDHRGRDNYIGQDHQFRTMKSVDVVHAC